MRFGLWHTGLTEEPEFGGDSGGGGRGGGRFLVSPQNDDLLSASRTFPSTNYPAEKLPSANLFVEASASLMDGR